MDDRQFEYLYNILVDIETLLTEIRDKLDAPERAGR